MSRKNLQSNSDYQFLVATLDARVDYIVSSADARNTVDRVLRAVATRFGHDAANDLIEAFELEAKGWKKFHDNRDEVD